MNLLIDKIQEILLNNNSAALCTIVETKGSTPRKVGAKMIVYQDGKIAGTIGGGNLEKNVIANALEQLKLNQPKTYKHNLLHEHNMCCGGYLSIYIEPIMKKNKLYIFGAGHTGHALADHASKIGFDIYIIDARKDYLDDINVQGVNKMNVEYKDALPSLPFDDNTYITIMTYEHAFDRDILSFCIKQPFAYLGMIGSKRKIELTKKMFLKGKIASEMELKKVDMPMGININAEGPQEVAISILAKLIQVKSRQLSK